MKTNIKTKKFIINQNNFFDNFYSRRHIESYFETMKFLGYVAN